MDLKKSYKADLERRRRHLFLLGLVFSLAAFVVALEYTANGGRQEDLSGLIDDMAQDIEMMPAVQQKDMIAAAPKQPKQPLTAHINIVDKPLNAAEEEKPIAETDRPDSQDGNSDGMAGAGLQDNGDNSSSAISPINTAKDDNPLNFQVIERLPEFPGGMVEFMKWLTKNLRYPVYARQQKIQGKVIVAFIINKDGTVSGQKVVKSVAPELDREALRVLRKMPKWKPGEDHGQPCRTYFSIPINFKL